MALARTTMSHNNNNNNDDTTSSTNNHQPRNSVNDKDEDVHEHDMVMPGFRFHPTEEELVEFYLRRKVEGKRFNVDLITFLDLYRYDPWELPALAAIGEKEWYFYVPRDRKYRNGDRPNRVTTSGYWKATGADRMIRSESSRSIGLKKTLVFYSGKAPKGIRSSWIMNEYRLPQHETERYQKAEISLCRVYKRAGVEDHPSLPRSFPSRTTSTRGPLPLEHKKQAHHHHHPHHQLSVHPFGGQSQQMEPEKMGETDGSSSSDVTTALGLSKQANNGYHPVPPIATTTLALPTFFDEHGLFNKQSSFSLIPNCSTNIFAGLSSNPVDDLHRLVNYQQAYMNHHHHQQQQQQQQQLYGHQPSPLSNVTLQTHQPLSLNMIPSSLPAAASAFSERLWDWNPIPEAVREYQSSFK